MAITEVKRMSMSDRIRARYEAHLKEVRDRNAREAYVRNEGWERGRTEGRLQEIFMSVQEGDYSIERGAQKAGMSMDAFKKVMAEAEQSLLLK